MKLQQEFRLARPRGDVWTFFQDVPAVASCLPGAEYLEQKDSGRHAGKMSVKVGPFQAAFEGEAEVQYDEASNAITMQGKGVDRKGASRGKMTMVCRLAEIPEGTEVNVDADVQLSGTIAQFGRTGIIQDIASVLISDFVRNFEARVPASSAVAAAEAETGTAPAAAAPPPQRPISGFRLVWLSFLRAMRRLFGASN